MFKSLKPYAFILKFEVCMIVVQLLKPTKIVSWAFEEWVKTEPVISGFHSRLRPNNTWPQCFPHVGKHVS